LHSNKKITATVCVYSGRQNPQWTISPKEYSKLLLLINRLSPASAAAETMLGYSGILVESGAQHLLVFNEIISITKAGNNKNYIDKGRLIERKLLKSVPGKIISEIKAMIPEELL
jgi:hypothetical protein